MSGGSGSPKSDLPFSPAVAAYMAGRLKAVALLSDRKWLNDVEPDPLSQIILRGPGPSLAHARLAIPKSWAQWELADFYRYAVPNAVFDLYDSPITRYDEFAYLYERLLGSEARPWLRSLFLAAAASPNLAPEHRRELIATFDLGELDFDAFEERQGYAPSTDD